jgi:hypothetical protein
MSEKKNLKMKLTLEKETLRVLDDSQLHLLDEAVGGMAEEGGCQVGSCQTSACPGSCGIGSCKSAVIAE